MILLKIAICDDDSSFRKEVKDALTNYFREKLIKPEIYLFDNGNDLLNDSICFEMAFLDVEMPGISGVEVGKQLKQKYNNITIFMITAFSNYLDDAFEIGAYRFLQKPLDIVRLYRSLDASLLSMSNKEIKIICANNNSVIISTNKIVFCETYKRKTRIVTVDGEYISREKIDYWKEKLNELNFCSPHNSFIINFNYIKIFNRASLTLEYSGQSVDISISPKRQKEFRTKMFLFAERGM